MTAEQIANRLLESEPLPDPDDPGVFLRNYADAFQRLGFALDVTDEGEPRWIWQEGNLEIEVVKAEPDQRAMRARAREGGYALWAFIHQTEPEGGAARKNAYQHTIVRSEQKALEVAQRWRKELPNSMAAQLTKLGFSGWRNHWHKSPIHVTLKPKFVNIDLSLHYVPNDQAIKALTALDKVRAKIFP